MAKIGGGGRDTSLIFACDTQVLSLILRHNNFSVDIKQRINLELAGCILALGS